MTTFQANGKTYRAYPTRWFCNGIEITSDEYLTALKSLRS